MEVTSNDPEFKKTGSIPVQSFPHLHLLRIGTWGDGNCLLHAILYSTSETYRSLAVKDKPAVAVKFRRILVTRIEELRLMADELYPDIGGADSIEDTFTDLTSSDDSYLGIELGNLIARMYGFNFLAMTIGAPHGSIGQKPSTKLIHADPIPSTYVGFDVTLPTILVNYVGQNHYESILMQHTDKVKVKQHTDIIESTMDRPEVEFLPTKDDELFTNFIIPVFAAHMDGGRRRAPKGGSRRTHRTQRRRFL